MKETIEDMEKRGILTDPQKTKGDNPLKKINCDLFLENMVNFKKGQIAFRDNPSLYHQLHNHASSCIKCGIRLGKFLRE